MQSFRKLRCLMLAAMMLPAAGCGMFTDITSVPVDEQTLDSRAENDSGVQTGTGVTTTEATTTSETTTTTPPPPPDTVLHVLAVGDNLVQTGVYNAAHNWSADGTYDFTKTYEHMKPIVQAADIAIINQETLICGGDYEISGSNLNFNSPVQLGDAMVDVGFDVFTLANNHMLDKRIDGLAASLDYWDGMMEKYPILALGAYRNEEDQNKIRVQEVNGVKIAYLAYTEHLNGYKIPEGSDIKIGLTSEEDLIKRQIEEANEIADAVIVAMHWGTEDTHWIREDVKELAKKVIGWGADVILGSHPHTAQTMEWIEREDGTKGFVYYSMGNFISAQTDNFNMVGEIAEFDLRKSGEDGEVTLENVTCMPCITQYDSAKFANCRVYPYYEYTADLASSHALPYAPLGTAKSFNMSVIDAIVEKNFPEEFRKLTWSPAESGTTETTAAAPAETTTAAPAETTTTAANP